MAGEKDCVAGGFGELLDASSDVDGVPDQGELQLASASDSASDQHTGVDPNTDPKLATEPLGDQPLNHHRSGHGGIGMIGKVVRGTKHGQSAVTEELVDVPTGVDHGRHHNFEQRVEAGDRVLGGVDSSPGR